MFLVSWNPRVLAVLAVCLLGILSEPNQAVSQSVRFDVPATVECFYLSEGAKVQGNQSLASSTKQIKQRGQGDLIDTSKGQGRGEQVKFGQVRPSSFGVRGIASHSSANAVRAKAVLPSRSNVQNAASKTVHTTFKIPSYQIDNSQLRSSKRKLVFTVPVSVIAEKAGSIQAMYIEIVPLSHQWKVRQISPESTFSSDQIGPIAIESKADSKTGINASAKGSYPVIGNLHLDLQASDNSHTIRRQQFKPKSVSIITSGTSDRGAGAFFRFRPTADFLIEGNHLVAIVFEVPKQWRGDLVRIRCQASCNGKNVTKNYLVAVYGEGDMEAEQLANHFSQVDRSLQTEISVKSQSRQKSTIPRFGLAQLMKPNDLEALAKLKGFLDSGKNAPSKASLSALPASTKKSLFAWLEARKKLLMLNRG